MSTRSTIFRSLPLATEEEQRDKDYCWTHKKIEKREEEEK